MLSTVRAMRCFFNIIVEKGQHTSVQY